ncbi:hypothetical protein KR074_008198 [Drosophila pseudoananassae]|nr:hypothetical protein KR074_008198 [Drosophila pseudoananassae]
MESRRVDFTNIKCNSFDRNFSIFEYCYIKAVNRTLKQVSLKVLLLQVPVNHFKVNFALYKRSNGQSPFNYNFTFDGCKMLDEVQNPFLSFLFKAFKTYTNINHSCPYDNDVIVDRLPTLFIHEKLTTVWPFPEGDYVFSSNWITSGVNRANVRIHASYS